jgi:hypothetical protein
MSEEMEIREKVDGIVERAGQIAIATAEDYREASEWLKAVKAAKLAVTEHFGGMKAAAHAAWKAIVAKEADAMKPLEEAEAMTKRKLLAYQQAEEAKRVAEEQRLQAIENERQRKEQERIEAAAKAQRDKEAAARAAEEAARAAGDLKAAAVAAKAAAAAAAKAEAKEEQAQMVAPPASISVASATPEVKGQSVRKTWKARLIDMQMLTGIPAGDIRLTFVTFDQAAANRFAVATKGSVKVKGVEFYCETSLASSSK